MSDLTPPLRIQRLLERFPPSGQEKTWHPNGADERSLLLWRYFQENPGEPVAIRFGRGLAYVMRHIAIAIHEDEWIVGEVGIEDVTTAYPVEWQEAEAFWQGRNQAFNRSFTWHAEEIQAGEHGLSGKWASRDGHNIPAFEMVLSSGLGGLKNRAREAAKQAAASLNESHHKIYWESMLVALQALSDYIQRYAVLAHQKAQDEKRPTRREELYAIAGTCAWLAENPPRTFVDALQLVWFIHLGIKLDDGGVGHSFGRFDQYLYPFLKADQAGGQLDEAHALELLACFWIKLNREGDDIAHLSLGGITPDGQDALNALTRLCLQVERWVRRKQPNLSTRVHKHTSDEYWFEVAATVHCGAGHPAIFNDDVIIPGLLAYGLPLEEARNYAQVGCVETFLPGLGAPWTDCYLNLAKCLELALNDGHDLRAGVLLGPRTGSPARFERFEDLFAAYERQVEAAIRQMLTAKDEYDTHLSEYAPEPLNSAFIRDCLENGQDATGGGARYLLTGAYGVGLGTTADSLAAIRQVVFDRGVVNLSVLVKALQDNFSGYERLRLLLLNRAPKYGNDDDFADAIAMRVIESFGHQVKSYSDAAWRKVLERQPGAFRRAYHYAMLGSVLSHTGMGVRTAATADGRLAGESLSDGGSPVQGANRCGATATLRSMAKADYRCVPGGAALNLRLTPEHYEGEQGFGLLASLLKAYISQGGEQLQVNMVSKDTLQHAFENPAAYRDLVVRVAGFTAYFVSLPMEMQLEILARS